jgi:hypothetical protein
MQQSILPITFSLAITDPNPISEVYSDLPKCYVARRNLINIFFFAQFVLDQSATTRLVDYGKNSCRPRFYTAGSAM